MAATMRWRAEYLQAVFPSSHAVNQVLELGVDDMENEEQKRLTKNAAMEEQPHGRLDRVTWNLVTSTSHLLDLDFDLNTT